MKIFVKSVVMLFLVITVSSTALAQTIGESKIGVNLPLSGPGGAIGAEFRDGMALCNQRVGLALVYEDNKTNPAAALTALKKLHDLDKINFQISIFSPITNALIPYARQNNIPIFASSISALSVVQNGQGSLVNFFTPGEEIGPIDARFAKQKLNLGTAAIIYIQDEYGESYLKSFTEEYIRLGGKVVAQESFPKEELDFKVKILKLKKSEPDLIYLVGYDNHIINGFKQAKELGVSSKLMSVWSSASPRVHQRNIDVFDGTYLSAPEFTWSSRPEVTDFKKAFHDTYKSEAGPYAAIGCDLISILGQHRNATASTVISELSHITNYNGITGEAVNSSVVPNLISIRVYPAVFKDKQIVRFD